MTECDKRIKMSERRMRMNERKGGFLKKEKMIERRKND